MTRKEIQVVINKLLKLKKDYTRPQGCSVTHMQINADKANTIHEAVVLLKNLQDFVGADTTQEGDIK